MKISIYWYSLAGFFVVKRFLSGQLKQVGNQHSFQLLHQGVMQGVFQIGNHFWVHENQCPNFDKLTKNKVFTEPLISKHRANHKLPPIYIKHCKPVFWFVFVVIIDGLILHFNISWFLGALICKFFFSFQTGFSPLMPGGNKRSYHGHTMLLAAGLLKYVWLFVTTRH